MWKIQKITSGTERGEYYSHSYYDIQVIDDSNSFIIAYKNSFSDRDITKEDEVEIGIIDIKTKRWTTVGSSKAWSWQQGPHAQWVPGKKIVMWNDRDNDDFISHSYNIETKERRSYRHPIYAIDPSGKFFLSLNFSRLNHFRPGYGYVSDYNPDLLKNSNDGVWKTSIDSGKTELILSITDCIEEIKLSSIKHRVTSKFRKYNYWINHIKLNPSGTRFTFKLRFREGQGGKWTEKQGVSFTCGNDGENLIPIANKTSHVRWLDNHNLFFWRLNGVYSCSDKKWGVRKNLGGVNIKTNAHITSLQDPGKFLYDTAYGEVIDLYTLDTNKNTKEHIHTFLNHRPPRGKFRCDLHPVTSSDESIIMCTSIEDGGRQIYILKNKT